METSRKEAFDHLVTVMQSPELSKVTQDEYNKKRFERVERALRTRPAFLPVSITLPTTAQSLPSNNQTREVEYDVIITGAITDGENKRINVSKNLETTRPIVKTGVEGNAKISLDAIAGKSKEASGITGIQAINPFVLKEDDSLVLEIFQDVETDEEETVNTVFTGSRVYDKNHSDAQLSKKARAAVTESINRNLTPQQRYAVVPIKFEDGKAIAETPKSEEPLLIVGFRTTVKNALINLGFSNDTKFSRDFFPIWALANEEGNYTKNYNELMSEIFLEPQQQLFFSLIDTIDGKIYAEDGQLELLVSTP